MKTSQKIKHISGTIIEINREKDFILVLDKDNRQWQTNRPKVQHKEGDLIRVKLQQVKDEWYSVFAYKEFENESEKSYKKKEE